jgi:hypothetical protein
MAMDNIQKSIIAVLGLSAVIALMTPTTDFATANSPSAPAAGQDLVQVPSPPDNGQDAPPPEDELSQDYVDVGETEESTIAFGEPTNSGLPFGQKPEEKAGPESPSETANTSSVASQNPFMPEAAPLQSANTVPFPPQPQN